MTMLVSLYFQLFKEKYLKVLSIILFDELSTCCFSYKRNMFVGLYEKHDAWKVNKIKKVQDLLGQ